MAGYRGTFVITWSQTETDGLASAPVSSVEVGATWRWRGQPVRIDGPGEILVLDQPEGAAELRRRAARAVRRIVGNVAPRIQAGSAAVDNEPLFDRYFEVSDGRRTYLVTLIDVDDLARPLLLFTGFLPPEDTDLWVVRQVDARPRPRRIVEQPAGVICFAGGTIVDTPGGPRPVEALREGDRLSTRDDGPQEILWIGRRHVSGARMQAMPELRPIRVRAGALGNRFPAPDLLVSPSHRLLLRGAVAEALFNAREVLVAAYDMLNDRTILRDHTLREVTYFHLMLERHQIVWANGVESESFHPAHTSLGTIEPGQRERLLAVAPGIERNPHDYGDPARRTLSTPEAAILLHEARRRH